MGINLHSPLRKVHFYKQRPGRFTHKYNAALSGLEKPHTWEGRVTSLLAYRSRLSAQEREDVTQAAG